MRNSRQKSRSSPPPGFLLRWAILILVGFAATKMDWKWLKAYPPMEYVRVEGALWYLDAEEFHRALLSLVDTGWFAVDTKKVEKSALEFPWVERVQVNRVWPDALVIRIWEQQPIARWGEDSLLNIRGEGFSPSNVASFTFLPQLIGPHGQEQTMLSQLRMLNSKLVAPASRVVWLRLSKRLAWTARLENGLEIEFGKQDPPAALDRLLTLLPRLGAERLETLRKVDLRYPNGFVAVFEQEIPSPVEPAITEPPG